MRLNAIALLVVTLSVPGAAQTIYPTTPDWISADTPFSTGAALVDLDRDGWLDLVVANGNDMAVEPLTVYYNLGNGTLPTTPDWQSSDTAYNGHLDVADVNGDGWPDVAVAVLGYASSIDHAAKLYLNNNGTLSSTPDWEAAELANAFGCAFGDVDNDGRPDLAVATGWAYNPQNFYRNWVYLNTGGTLASSASWQSDDLTHLQGVLWIDANDDGWLDLVGVANRADTMVYTNLGGTLETTASWDTSDSANQDGIMAVCGDVTGDGHPDLIVTDNTQLAGASGRFRQYDGLAGGYFETTYGWSYFEGNGSAVALADIDADGDLDLATGAWWDNTRVFLNPGSGLPATPSWSSAPASVVEKIVFGDVDNVGVRTTTESFPYDGRQLHFLAHRPIHAITGVRVDGAPLGPDQYTFSIADGWIVTAPAASVSVEVDYLFSTDLDMAVSNWDDSVGNFLYYNRLAGAVFADGFETGDTGRWDETSP